MTGRRHHQSTGALGGTRELTVVPPPSGLSVLATYQEFEQARPACPTGSGPAESGLVGSGGPDPDDDGFRAEPLNDAPPGVIRLRFDDAPALERAGAAFAVAPDLGEAWSDPSTLTLRIVADAGVETLRAVLAVIDSAALAVRSLTVHTHELDDVFAAFTSLP